MTVLNLPPYATEESIARVFSVAGPVENVMLADSYKNEQKNKYQVTSKYFHEARALKYQIGFIVFKKSESIDIILRSSELPPLSTAEHPILTGIAKWSEQYNNRTGDSEKMQTEIDEYMKHYDKVKRAGAQQEDEADDEGWTTVGKKGFQQKESVISKLEQKIQNQKKKAKNLTSFYSFEMRESKKQQLVELRKKYEEDKTKMYSMKQNRKFRPY